MVLLRRNELDFVVAFSQPPPLPNFLKQIADLITRSCRRAQRISDRLINTAKISLFLPIAREDTPKLRA